MNNEIKMLVFFPLINLRFGVNLRLLTAATHMTTLVIASTSIARAEGFIRGIMSLRSLLILPADMVYRFRTDWESSHILP